MVFVKGVPAAEPYNHTVWLDFVKLRRYKIAHYDPVHKSHRRLPVVKEKIQWVLLTPVNEHLLTTRIFSEKIIDGTQCK